MTPTTNPQTHETPDEEIRAHTYVEGASAFEAGRRGASLVAPMSGLVQALHLHPAYLSCRGQATGCVRIHPDLTERPLGQAQPVAIPVPDPVPPLVLPVIPDQANTWPAIGEERPLPSALDPMGYGDGSAAVL